MIEDLDARVAEGNGCCLATKLTALGASVELRLYPGKNRTDTIKSLSPAFRGSTPALADSVAFLRRLTPLPTSRG